MASSKKSRRHRVQASYASALFGYIHKASDAVRNMPQKESDQLSKCFDIITDCALALPADVRKDIARKWLQWAPIDMCQPKGLLPLIRDGLILGSDLQHTGSPSILYKIIKCLPKKIEAGTLSVIRELLSTGACPNEVCDYVSLLEIATTRNVIEVVRLLLDAGANPECDTRSAPSQEREGGPIDIALYHGFIECATLLYEAGAPLAVNVTEGSHTPVVVGTSLCGPPRTIKTAMCMAYWIKQEKDRGAAGHGIDNLELNIVARLLVQHVLVKYPPAPTLKILSILFPQNGSSVIKAFTLDKDPAIREAAVALLMYSDTYPKNKLQKEK